MLSKKTVDVWSDSGKKKHNEDSWSMSPCLEIIKHILSTFFTWKSMMSRKCSRSWVFVVFLLADGLTLMGHDGG